MFKLCLFDLDDTLVRTDDLQVIREAGKEDSTQAYKERLHQSLEKRGDRHIYSPELLKKIRATFPDLKLGVFTRSPRNYALIVLGWAYPDFRWDIVVAYGDVGRTKPYGDGIDEAMSKFGILHVKYLPVTMLVGDNSADIRSAYNCGCVALLDKGAWPSPRRTEHWRALELVPDAMIESPDQLLEVLANPSGFLPELERALVGDAPHNGEARFDRIGHFFPGSAGGDDKPRQIHVCGRLFANYKSLRFRKGWHALTESIEANKQSDVFPEEWIATVRTFIAAQYRPFSSVAVSVIPHRPDRKPRLENFLAQLQASLKAKPIPYRKIAVYPELLAYKEGVRSNHGEFLNRDERFANVRDFLFVKQSEVATSGTAVLIIDDVVTTGASLIYAQKYLMDAGARDVRCLAIAKNVGDVL
jgi:phosphoglycolate phosphatase-like HAD superfamily hydrolase